MEARAIAQGAVAKPIAIRGSAERNRNRNSRATTAILSL
ncbi:hypothetical protein NIES4073_38660 [Kalymmatonema gypsitolerans NIES-4073]|nr:hypothetical protein NIES4073_38660 [Scytonema sp. NIES-4073]